MKHRAIEQVIASASGTRSDSDFAFFFSQLVSAEALAKTIVGGMVSAIGDDKDRNRYRLEHMLVRADGLGDWGRALEDAMSGTASQFLLVEARQEQAELTRSCKSGDWQYDATSALGAALDHLKIEAEDVPVKSDLKRWFRLFATLRNKTRAHGATKPAEVGPAAEHIERSVSLIHANFSLFRRSWAHLYRNLSGKYRVSAITVDSNDFDFLKSGNDAKLENGIYIFFDKPRQVRLMSSDPELRDFHFPNGGLRKETFELLSYATNTKIAGDASPFLLPPGLLPASETEGHGELLACGNCFSNAPDERIDDYVVRNELEIELKELLLDDRRPIVTLVGRGGIGKTSLALHVIHELFNEERYEAVVWFSARDVDLSLEGPKPVRPAALSVEDVAKSYAALALSDSRRREKDFKATAFFEKQLQNCELGNCLFVFDNFETMRNPVEMFKWIDTYIRLPNKVLITTRLRDFKGDYPLEVRGMNDNEARKLIDRTAQYLNVQPLIGEKYKKDLIEKSEGHPYIIKVLLGEVSKEKRAANIPRMIAGTEDVLTALFERTFAILSPCARRAFLTLSAWNSSVPQVALEAVLIRSTQERSQVEKGIEELLQFSIAETNVAESDGQVFISLPLVASVFGKKKLNISTAKAAIRADVEILQMLGPTMQSDLNIGLAKRLERMIGNISRRIEDGEAYGEYAPILEAICLAYPPGWLLLAKWHMEARNDQGYEQAKEELRRFLETSPSAEAAGEAWQLLGHSCYQTGDALGEVHSFIERAHVAQVPFYDLSNTANRFNLFLRENREELEKEEKSYLADRLASVLQERRSEANSGDLSRMAWLEIHRGQEVSAREYVEAGLEQDPTNHHLIRLAQRFGISY